jgi:hypothetical protein
MRGLTGKLGHLPANSEAQKREVERKRLEEELAATAMKWDGIQKTMLDEKAWLSQVELARFLKSRMAEHTPRNLANAVAGLPDIGCRVSFRRCRKFPFQTEEPGFILHTFEFVKGCWEKRGSRSASGILRLFSSEIAELSEKTRNKHTGKKEVNYFRKHLEDNWPELADAIVETVKSDPSLRQAPYLVLSLFQRNMAKPRTALDLLLREDRSIAGQ